MPKGIGYGNKKAKKHKGTGKAGKKIESAARTRVGNKTKGTLLAKPGAKTHMSRSGAMGGKNPNAQTSKPKKTHTMKKALK